MMTEIGVFMLRGAQSIFSSPTLLISVETDAQKSLWKSVLHSILHMLEVESTPDLQALISCE